MSDTRKIYDELRAVNLDDAQARAVAEVMMMTRRSSARLLDTAKMRDVLRAAGFDEKKTRALLDMQIEAHKEMYARAANA